MFYVDNPTGVPVMPEPSPVSSLTDLFFTEGGNGVPPTYPGPDWFNIVQSELLNIVRASGLDPDKMTQTQILDALKKLFLQRQNPFGDIKADGAAAVATALANLGLVGGNFASGQGYSLNYFKIPVNTPSGLVTKIIQYGNVALILGSDNKIGFPIPFPNAVRAWYATCNYTTGSGTLVNVNCVAGLSDITLRASASVTAFWLAIGE